MARIESNMEQIYSSDVQHDKKNLAFSISKESLKAQDEKYDSDEKSESSSRTSDTSSSESTENENHQVNPKKDEVFEDIEVSKCCKMNKQATIISQIILTGMFFILELVVGHSSNSLSLQADAYHMLSDLLSMIVSLVAIRYGKRDMVNNSGKIPNTFGWVRADILGGLINAVFLISSCFSILIEALSHFSSPEPIDRPNIVLYVACAGLAINIISLGLFHNHAFGGHSHSHHHHSHGNDHPHGKHSNSKHSVDHIAGQVSNSKKPAKNNKSLNFQGMYWHVLADLMGSIIVIVDCLVIIYVKQDWTKYLDPSLSIFTVIVLLAGAIPIVKKSCGILVQMTPPGFNVSQLKSNLISNFPDILGIHDFHIWLLTSDKIVASIHILFQNQDDYRNNLEKIKSHFHQINIHSITIQPEFIDDAETDSCKFLLLDQNNCQAQCPSHDCDDKRCC